ncbi:MAG: DUF3015 domain-containing protein [Candidatus Electrothrix sp. GM3_4]|nr:DUF3015 domain-containing protein [Candidatus Electrothrix sp. GM3_4]
MSVKKITLFATCFAASLILAQAATAREFVDIYIDCGLGAIIAPRTPVVAAITNVTWDLGTTAVLSNISFPQTCSGGQARMAAFVHDAYDSLEADLAAGEGGYLDSLTALAGVEDEKKVSFVKGLRENFAESVAATDYTQQTRFIKANNLYNTIYQELENRS